MTARKKQQKRPRTSKSIIAGRDLCVDCYKVIGVKSRYGLVRMLGMAQAGLNVSVLTKRLKLRQPTVTYHLNILKSLNVVIRQVRGRERVYTLNRNAHCFEECKIPVY